MEPLQVDRRSASDERRARAARRDLVPGLVLLVLTEGSLLVADPDAGAGAAQLAWSLSPLVAIGLLAWAQVRVLRRSDERERLQQLTAMAVGFAVVIVLLAVAGVLQAADLGDAPQQLQVTFVAGVLAWIAALGVLTGRGS